MTTLTRATQFARAVHSFTRTIEEIEFDGALIQFLKPVVLHLSCETEGGELSSPIHLDYAETDGSFFKRLFLPVWQTDALEAYVKASQAELARWFGDEFGADVPKPSSAELFA